MSVILDKTNKRHRPLDYRVPVSTKTAHNTPHVRFFLSFSSALSNPLSSPSARRSSSPTRPHAITVVEGQHIPPRVRFGTIENQNVESTDFERKFFAATNENWRLGFAPKLDALQADKPTPRRPFPGPSGYGDTSRRAGVRKNYYAHDRSSPLYA